MPMPDWFKSLATINEGRAHRSTAMQPLVWLAGIVLLGFVGAITQGVSGWPLMFLAGVAGIVVFVFIAHYTRFAFGNSDALRSERFVIRKMEIEQASIGDTRKGALDEPEDDEPHQLPEPPR